LVEREPHPQGFITYGPEGRMMVLILRGTRPKPESVDKITDQQRADLFRTMTAYTGTYTIDGASIVHNIDLSWNEAWTGTKQVRYFKKQGDKLELSTLPYRFSGDGFMIINSLVWEKIR
jgi:lipocalin-like protein